MLRTHYVGELESLRNNIVDMGLTTIAILEQAIEAVGDPSRAQPERARDLEVKTDGQHKAIHDQCLKLITLQAPVASDARLVTGILDTIVDLELIGDYAEEIVTLCASIVRKPPSQVLGQIADAARRVRDVLSLAVDSWRKTDGAQATSVRSYEAPIRAECEALYEKVSQLVSTPGEGIAFVDLMLVCKQLERILRHALCVAAQAAEAAPMAHHG